MALSTFVGRRFGPSIDSFPRLSGARPLEGVHSRLGISGLRPGALATLGSFFPFKGPNQTDRGAGRLAHDKETIETILLIDDEEMVRDLGERVLKRAGYVVLTAGNGKEALDIYKRNLGEISLVILDLIMPEMGGKRCLEELLKIDPKAKVLIATGFSPDFRVRAELEAAAKGFVGKPFEIRELLEKVREVLTNGSA